WGPSGLFWDRQGRHQARGAYLHLSNSFLAGLLDSKRLAKAFRLKDGETGRVDREELRRLHQELLMRIE
ncbi:MAG: hypothetical protein DCC75_13035, partial [Proteobacteria bacterium]